MHSTLFRAAVVEDGSIQVFAVDKHTSEFEPVSPGERIKQLRTLNNYSQVMLADACMCCKTAISQFETGRREPSVDTIRQICVFLNISLGEFFENVV